MKKEVMKEYEKIDRDAMIKDILEKRLYVDTSTGIIFMASKLDIFHSMISMGFFELMTRADNDERAAKIAKLICKIHEHNEKGELNEFVE